MNVGIVFGGGASKGAYQIGFINALSEFLPRQCIKAISCSSIGILNGYAYSANKFDKIGEMWKNCNFENKADLFRNVWFKGYFVKTIKAIVEKSDFLEIPSYMSVCYLPFIKIRYYKLDELYKNNWYKLIRGAMYFPLASGGLRFFRGSLAVDGGLIDNIPLLPLVKNEDLDLIFVLHFQSQYRVPLKYKNSKAIIIDIDVSHKNLFRKYFLTFDNETIKEMIQSGYEYGKSICGRMFANGIENLQSIRKEVTDIYAEEKEYRLEHPNMTWVSRANAILSPLSEKAHCIKDLNKKEVIANEIASVQEMRRIIY